MVSRLHIVHRTTFDYDRTVTASYNEARIAPLQLPHQTVLYSRVTATPATHQASYADFWGFDRHVVRGAIPHTGLVVVSIARRGTAPTAATVPKGRTRTPNWSTGCAIPRCHRDHRAADDLVALARDTVGDHSPSKPQWRC